LKLNWLDGAGSGRYRAIARANRLSPEITIMSEADTVHVGAGNILMTGSGEVMRTRRGRAANKIFGPAGESPVLAICPFQPSRHIRHAGW
jgi:hypothetical protein